MCIVVILLTCCFKSFNHKPTFLLIGDLKDRLEDGCRTIESKEEYFQLAINQLYEVINGIEVYAILNINDKEVTEMLKPFSIMMQTNKTIISHTVWNDHVRKKVSGAKLSLPEVAKNVWAPCLKEMQQIVERFYNGSVTLQEIDYYLKDILPQNLQQEVFSLVEGCNKYLNKKAPNSWISQFVMSVNRYRVICQAQQAAELVLKARDALMLTGDFKKLENLREKVLLFICYHIILTMFCRCQSI